MLISRGNLIRPNVLSFTLICTVLLSEVILGTALEQTKSSTKNADETKALPQTNTDLLAAEGDELPVTGELFEEACFRYIHNFTYSAIVSYNMNPSQARKWHKGRDNATFQRLAANLTRTIMQMVEEMNQVGAMFVYKDNSTTAKYSDSDENYTLVETPAFGASSENSDVVVPWLIFVILALVLYIGFLTYQIKTKYRNSGSGILIEEH